MLPCVTKSKRSSGFRMPMMMVRCGCPTLPSIRYLIAFTRTVVSRNCCGVLDCYLNEPNRTNHGPWVNCSLPDSTLFRLLATRCARRRHPLQPFLQFPSLDVVRVVLGDELQPVAVAITVPHETAVAHRICTIRWREFHRHLIAGSQLNWRLHGEPACVQVRSSSFTGHDSDRSLGNDDDRDIHPVTRPPALGAAPRGRYFFINHDSTASSLQAKHRRLKITKVATNSLPKSGIDKFVITQPYCPRSSKFCLSISRQPSGSSPQPSSTPTAPRQAPDSADRPPVAAFAISTRSHDLV